MPKIPIDWFELTSVMFNMLRTMGQFGGSINEDARGHIKSFMEQCNSLKLFSYSWLNNLPPGSLQSWTELYRSFLAIFSYTNMTDKIRNEITEFRKEEDESLYEAWERYKILFQKCPMHRLNEWTQVSIFYNVMNSHTRTMINASANGTLLERPANERLQLLDRLAKNDYQHPTTRRGYIHSRT